MKTLIIPMGFKEHTLTESDIRQVQMAILKSDMHKSLKDIADAIMSYMAISLNRGELKEHRGFSYENPLPTELYEKRSPHENIS